MTNPQDWSLIIKALGTLISTENLISGFYLNANPGVIRGENVTQILEVQNYNHAANRPIRLNTNPLDQYEDNIKTKNVINNIKCNNL